MPPERKRVLITVRTYPTPSAKVNEQSCTAGITSDGDWIRLFPIPWRYLGDDQKFRKYELIDVTVHKARSDPRVESYNPELDSIEIIGSVPADNGWAQRKDYVFPLLSHCMCCAADARNQNGAPTLAVFKPGQIDRLRIFKEKLPDWSEAELAKLSQAQFRMVNGEVVAEPPNIRPLQKVPFKFFYYFRCDHDYCNGHRMSCTDWEMLEACRKWRARYGEAWEEPFRRRFETDMKRWDTHFFVGTVASHPGNWLIVGLFYPPHQAWAPGGFDHPQSSQPELFSLQPD